MTAVAFVDETPFGFGWMLPDEGFMRRCSHAVAVGGSVWVVDPVDGEGVVDRIRALGDPAGVLVLFGRHERDSVAFAERLGVPRYVVPHAPSAAPFDLVPLGRKERALWVPGHAALLVPEAVGTAPFMRAPGEHVGLHPLRRLAPPTELRAFEAEHLLFGHGEGLHGADATNALRETLAHGRRRAASWAWSKLTSPRRV